MTELKPCPFCGGKADYVYNSEAVEDAMGRKWAYTVVCGRCVTSSGLCFSKEQALKAWNKRINDKTKFENDCISRQDAIDILVKEASTDGVYGYVDIKSIIDLLGGLPEVYPKMQKGEWVGKFMSDIGDF